MGIKPLYFFGQTPLSGVVHLPLVYTRFIDPKVSLSSYDYLIFTSKRAIEAMLFFHYDITQIPILCVGKKTARYAKNQGLNVAHISVGYAQTFIEEIKRIIGDKKALYLRPKKVANDYIIRETQTDSIDESICYETLCRDELHAEIIQPAVLLFAAPSQIACFEKHFAFHEDDLIVCIGTTTQEAVKMRKKVYLSDEPSLESLVLKGESLRR